VPLAAEGQEAGKVSRIGLLGYSAGWEPFRHALRDLGYAEGRNIAIEDRLTEGRLERLHELVRLKVDVLVTAGTPPTQAAMRATTTIPIVMVSTGDPLRPRRAPGPTVRD
jgi:putative ABC transport system substrate-binding protein